MKLSIITINRNNGNGLKQTLASVAGQTFMDLLCHEQRNNAGKSYYIGIGEKIFYIAGYSELSG